MGNNLIILKTDKRITIEILLNEILKKSVNPQDKYEVVAILESIGWNDARAEENFGVEDVFELATIIWNLVQEKVKQESIVHEKELGLSKKIILMIKSFLRGLIFALPMAISVAAMLTLRFSLWSYEYLSTELATSISIGTILSFMSVGGFTQAIARRGFFYLSQGIYSVGKRVTYYLIKMGYTVCIIVAIIYLLFNLFFYNFTGNMLFVIIIYYLFLTSNWLSVTVMYILRRELTFTALITFGIFVVYVLFRIIKLNIILSQIISLIIISIIGLILVVHFFNKSEEKNEKGIAPPLPRMSIMMYTLVPFFIYGFLYFTFIYIDRIIAWSTNNMYMPYIIWFRGEYELGLDFALLTLILPMGFSELIVTKLMQTLEIIQRNNMVVYDFKSINTSYIKLYIRNMVYISFCAIVSSTLVYVLVKYINNNSLPFLHNTYLYNSTTYFVFAWALIAYSILVLALTNSMILFSLSQPNMVIRVLLYSVMLNCIVGFLLSRWIDYHYAVIGLLVGCIAFMVGTTFYVLKVLDNLDYYIYAAL